MLAGATPAAGATAAAACVGVCYVTSYLRARWKSPATKDVREAFADLKVATGKKDTEAVLMCLQRLRQVCSDDVSKAASISRIGAVVACLRSDATGLFALNPECVLRAVKFINEWCGKAGAIGYGAPSEGPQLDENAVAGLVAAEGVRQLFRTMSRAYKAEAQGAVYRDIASEAASTLEIVTTVSDKVVLDFDVPASGVAARQLAGVKGLRSLLHLARDDGQSAWHKEKRVTTKVLGILRNVTTLRCGARTLCVKESESGESRTPDPFELFMHLARKDPQTTAYGAAVPATADQECASMCVMHLLRHVRECRDELLRDAASGSGELADGFLDLLDCTRIGRPPSVSDKGKFACRPEKVTFAALQCVEYLVEKSDMKGLGVLLARHNDWGLMSLFGIMARYRLGASRQAQRQQLIAWKVRGRCRQIMREISACAGKELNETISLMRKHNGGSRATTWGIKFPVAQELQRTEIDDTKLEKEMQRTQQQQQMRQQQQQQMQMQQMMMSGDLDESQMAEMMGMGFPPM